MKRLLTLWLWLHLALCVMATPGLELTAKLEQSADPLPFGKPATLVLNLSWDEKWAFQPPTAESLELPGFTIIDRFTTTPNASGGKRSLTYHLIFTRFEPGPAVVPAVSFETPDGTFKSQPKKIVYKGAEAKPGDDPDQLRGPKDVVPLSTADFWWWLAKVLGLSLLALVVLTILVRKLGLLDRWLSPRSRALRRLAKLTKAMKAGQMEGSEALLETVEVLRVYLHAAHGFVTREATSREISEQLILSNRCPDLKPTARKILEHGDQAKFARREPNLEESQDMVEQLRAAITADKRGTK